VRERMNKTRSSQHPVVILNMAYTGLGIARNLYWYGMPIVGVTAKRDIVGNHTRRAQVVFAPDSAESPQELSDFLVQMAGRFAAKPVLFATRDQDVSFVEQFRGELAPHYLLPIPNEGVLSLLLDKWSMAQAAQAADIPMPVTHRLSGLDEIQQLGNRLPFPCVVKPITSSEWRGDREWKLIGQRKAFSVHSYEELLSEYKTISQVTPQILLQELIPGPDSNLYTFGCYFDRNSDLKGSFFGRKLLQYPAGFGTGFVVECAAPSAVQEYSVRLLQSLRYHGVAECEFKLDGRDGKFKFIEANARHWDQHRLSTACGVNLSELAYLDMCDLAVPVQTPKRLKTTWVAEDSFLFMGGRMVLEKQISWMELLRMIRGRRVYGWFSATDPSPFLRLLGSIVRTFLQRIWHRILLSFQKTPDTRIDVVSPPASRADGSKSATAP
jgi:D-aspartate ligase